MTLSVLLDAVVAVLLVATIGFCIVLSRRLGALRDDKRQLEALAASLVQSSQRAESGIAALRGAADQIGRQLEEKIAQGQGLKNDLGYIVELGGGVADRLEASIRSGREDGKSDAPAKPARAEPDPVARRERAAAAATGNERPLAAPAGGAGADGSPRVAGFPSRAERLLRRALDARR